MKTILKKGIAFTGALFLLSMFKLDVAIPGSDELLSLGACSASAQGSQPTPCWEAGQIHDGAFMYLCEPCQRWNDWVPEGPAYECTPHS